MTALPKGKKVATTVDLREPTFVLHREMPGTRVLASFAIGWQCRRTPAGHVLVLWYNCPDDLAESVPQEFCTPDKECERYISTSGQPMDSGFARDDKRYGPLRATLGYHDDAPGQSGDEGSFAPID